MYDRLFTTFRCSCLIFILLLHWTCISCQRSDGALTVVTSPEDDSPLHSDNESEAAVQDEEEEEAFEVVQPTDQWQTLQPGQAVPRGSHVRLNLQTGQREVRIGEEQLKYWTQQHRYPTENGQTLLKKAMKKMKEDLNINKDQQESVSSRFRPLEELKKDMAQMDLLVETDIQILRRLLDQFNSTRSTDERVTILHELEYMVHQVDNGQTLCSMGGLVLILDGLNSTDSRLQESSAFVLGSAMASNPAVQVKAVESGALQTLLTVLATTEHFSVQKKVLFAVASLLRNFPFAQEQFLSRGGLQVMSEVFRGDKNGSLRTRIVTLLHDLITEKVRRHTPGLWVDPSHEERLHQYSRVSLDKELVEKNWCGLVPQLLESSEHDSREKALRALLAMTSMCCGEYRSDRSLLTSLVHLKAHYEDMVSKEQTLGEDTGYFGEILELVDNLKIKIR
uniref:Nucleotide exchange factor SIL1 n=1 Tax=Neogobius melanostomus TaxID=47308 RepID=A0A8C6SQR9_9GOBI